MHALAKHREVEVEKYPPLFLMLWRLLFLIVGLIDLTP